MKIGGGKLSVFQLRRSESLCLQSTHDVEEISDYANTLNPVNLFWRGSQFLLGRLFLTDRRLILLPYSREDCDRALRMQDVSYQLLDKVGFGIPKPEIEFECEPLVIGLNEIEQVNPFRRQFVVHPTLSLLTHNASYRFKFVAGDSPQSWANAIAELTACEISDRAA